jgi:type II secretory pathway component PulF
MPVNRPTSDPAPERPNGPSGRIDEDRLAGRMADVASAGLPLAAGLRVMAEETTGRDRRGLLTICDRLEAGDPPDRALETAGADVSSHLVGIVRAGMRSGELGPLLTQYVERNRERADRRRNAIASLSYPLILAAITLGLLGFLFVFVVPGFVSIFEGFGTELPALTKFVLACAEFLRSHPWVIVTVFAVLGGLLIVAATTTQGAIVLQRCLYVVPVLGPIVRFNALASFCDLLGLVVSQRVPLPEALRMTASAVGDPELSRAARWMADDVERGIDPSRTPHDANLPTGLQQAFLWSDDGTAFGESLTAAARIYDARARINADLLHALLAPVVIVTLAATIGTVVVALFMPLIKLLNDLS